MNPIAVISRVEARGIARRRWSLAVMVIGAAIIIAGAVVAAGRGGLAAEDTMQLDEPHKRSMNVEIFLGAV